jgi:DNA-binding PadR family transcriptional regulator
MTPDRSAATFLPLTPAVFHILLALSDGALHGYGIMRSVERVTLPVLRMGPGTIYGSLERMERSGLVEDRGVDGDGRRRLFGLTPLGRRVLDAEAARLRGLVELLDARESGAAP